MTVENIKIIPFQESLASHFHDLNMEWLQRYFYVEPHDTKVLENPQSYIIDNGGFIFFATYKNTIVGTLALINEKEGFELSKMAVAPAYQGLKIGLQLMEFAISFAKKKQWKSLLLYSNKKLVPAISLYKKVGFNEVPLEEDVYYERADIKMVLQL